MSEYQGIEELFLLEEVAVNYNHWLFTLCKSYIRGDLIEIGAGIGTFTNEWLDVANSVVALEVADNCLKILNKRFKDNKKILISSGDIMTIDTLPASEFDSAVSLNVFEHIEEDTKALLNVRKILRRNGKFVIYVPAFSYIYGQTDISLGHHRRYDKKSLDTKLKKAGFTVIETKYVNSIGWFAWYLTRNSNKALSKQNIYFYDKFVVPWLKSLESAIKLPFGQSLIAVASCDF